MVSFFILPLFSRISYCLTHAIQPDFTANTITFPFKAIITSMNHLYDVFILFKVH